MRFNSRKNSNNHLLVHGHAGYTLIELMIGIVLLTLLMVAAIPSYTDFVAKSNLAEAPATLSLYQARLEQVYAKTKSYQNAKGDCNTLIEDSDNFTYTCEILIDRYLITASNSPNVGLGVGGNYSFSLNSDGLRKTPRFDGKTGSDNCWLKNESSCL